MCVEFKNVQLNLNIPPGLRLSGDTTALLVQLNQLVCGVVWCGVVYHCIVSRIHSARVAYKRNPVCVLPSELTHISRPNFIIWRRREA